MAKHAGKIEKTNAARLLDRAGVKYKLIPYEVDENDLAATHVAASLGEPIERVYKTLVLKGDRTGYFVCVVQGDKEVDLKAAARVSGNKSADMIPMKDLLGVTGYIRGGCSPVGTTCEAFDYIYVSAGVRGLQLRIAPQDLIGFVGATVAEIEH